MSRDRPNKIKLPHRPGYTTYLQTGDLTSTDGEEGVYSLKLITGYTREEVSFQQAPHITAHIFNVSARNS